MCKKVEEVLKENTEEPVLCKVLMDGKEHESDDFVCIMSRENGDASLFYNTDALTLGMAMKMVAKAFVDAMHQLTEEERQSIQEVLGDAYVVESAPKEVSE